jgi:hypothetical protein
MPVPTPNYEYDVEILVKYYKKAITQIQNELKRFDLSDMSRANQNAVLANISETLSKLNEDSAKWVEEHIPKAARDGVINTIVSLGVAETVQEASELAKFNRLNQNLVKAIVADTQADLLEVTNNVERKVRAAVRRVTAEVMRDNLTKGINGRVTINREILKGLRETLGDSLDTGIVDTAQRKWKPQDYVDMLTRTKVMEAYNEATTNEAVQRGAYYAIISSHGAKDPCRFHEGRIIKLTPDAPGGYPTYAELQATLQIFHMRCKHTYSPTRDVNLLPQSVRDLAEKQAEKGNKAIATGKRNPKDID